MAYLGLCPWFPQETKQPGTGWYIRCIAHLGQCVTKHLISWSLDLGRTQNAQPIWVCAPCRAAKNLSTLDLGMHETQGPIGKVPRCWDHPGSWSRRAPEVHSLGLWLTQCGPATASTRSICLQGSSLHSTPGTSELGHLHPSCQGRN